MVFLDHVQNLHIHAEKTHKDSGAHCMNMLILYMVQKTHTGPYYRVLALFMCGVVWRSTSVPLANRSQMQKTTRVVRKM